MGVRNILVSLDPLADPTPLLRCASETANALNARVGISAAARPWGDVVNGAIGPEALALYQEQRAQIEEALTQLERRFEEMFSPDVRATFRGVVDNPTQHLIDTAASTDLVLIGSERTGTRRPAIQVDAGKVVLSSGRPVMLASEKTSISFDAILIAWKDTREARRAVADALPMLKLASSVMVATVDEDEYAVERERLRDVLSWLQGHGISARSDILPAEGSVTDTLASVAKAIKADLIVSGAYGRTRLQEWLFGGATRELLQLHSYSRLLSN